MNDRSEEYIPDEIRTGPGQHPDPDSRRAAP
jgi:hypothetical protein